MGLVVRLVLAKKKRGLGGLLGRSLVLANWSDLGEVLSWLLVSCVVVDETEQFTDILASGCRLPAVRWGAHLYV